MTERKELTLELAKRLTDEGLLIEAGWIGLAIMALPPDCPPAQIQDMRVAFFAGAQHLFDSMMGILDPGGEPTAADEARMNKIQAELNRFAEQFSKWNRGRAHG